MILLANPNSTAATTRAMCAILSPVLPDLRGWTAPEGPPIIQTPAQLDAAARLVAAIRPPQGCRGVIVAAFGDPGAAALARRLAIPVVGIGASAAIAAGAGNRAFAVATTTPALADRIDAMMSDAAAGPSGGRYLGCFLTDGPLPDLMADPPALDAALLQAVRRAAQAGAQAVIIGGGPLAEAARRLAPLSPVPLIQPLQAAARALLDRLAAG